MKPTSESTVICIFTSIPAQNTDNIVQEKKLDLYMHLKQWCLPAFKYI